MSDKIQKFLAKLQSQELEKVIAAIANIERRQVDNLNIKPITGKKGYFRIRVGRVRIIYRITNDGSEIIDVTNRNEKTYKNL